MKQKTSKKSLQLSTETLQLEAPALKSVAGAMPCGKSGRCSWLGRTL